MRNLLIAHALLLAAAGADGSAGGAPNEPDPNTNDAGAAPDPELATGGEGTVDSNLGAHEQRAPAPDPELEARLKAEREAFEKERAETPPQTVKLRPDPNNRLLGIVIYDAHYGETLRAIRMEDWRTDQIALRMGECLVVHVLAGEGLDHFEQAERTLAKKNEPPAPAKEPEKAVGETGIGAGI